ncbi:MAG: hypothetical protein JSS79_02475 [Bacteroidetes bacterium]|nr:hypothetical protein [Bacteroidota bacterium]
MKKIIIYGLSSLLMMITVHLLLVGCADKCQVKTTYYYYQPVYTTMAEIKTTTGLSNSIPLNTPGKIYWKDQKLYINEVGKGIHLIDNSNPSSPVASGFLKIPGNFDLAIEGNTLYADSYIDLVMFDVSDWSAIKEVNRIEGFFKNYNTFGFYADPVKGIVTNWEKTSAVSVQENNCGPSALQTWGGIYYDKGIAFAQAANSATSTAALPTNPTTGISGSMARFTIAKNFLYAIDGTTLAVADISNAAQPQRKADVTLLSWPETVFPYGENLFIGSRAGMAIFDLASPDQPLLLSTYDHIYSCDPVVVQGNYAYVTLYNGDICHNNTNELQVIDITNLKSPSLRNTYKMTNPHGLGIDQNTLFICDGADGLKVYDASNPDSIGARMIAHYPNINAVDLIPYQNVAMVIGTDGLYQYDYSQPKNIKLLSKISIVK